MLWKSRNLPSVKRRMNMTRMMSVWRELISLKSQIFSSACELWLIFKSPLVSPRAQPSVRWLVNSTTTRSISFQVNGDASIFEGQRVVARGFYVVSSGISISSEANWNLVEPSSQCPLSCVKDLFKKTTYRQPSRQITFPNHKFHISMFFLAFSRATDQHKGETNQTWFSFLFILLIYLKAFLQHIFFVFTIWIESSFGK